MFAPCPGIHENKRRKQSGCLGAAPRRLSPARASNGPYERLLDEIEATNYSAVGRKYGVSDNAVRKWLRWYEAERTRREGDDHAA